MAYARTDDIKDLAMAMKLEQVDGGVKEGIVTPVKPTSEATQLHLAKSAAANDRDYEARDSTGKVVFKTGEVMDGKLHTRYFTLYDGTNDQALCEVKHVDMELKDWEIIKFHGPKGMGERITRVVHPGHKKEADVVLYKIMGNSAKDEFTVLNATDGTSVLVVKETDKHFGSKKHHVSHVPGNKEDAPVAFWICPDAVTSHFIELDMAKGVDPALHVIMTVITNMAKGSRIKRKE